MYTTYVYTCSIYIITYIMCIIYIYIPNSSHGLSYHHAQGGRASNSTPCCGSAHGTIGCSSLPCGLDGLGMLGVERFWLSSDFLLKRTWMICQSFSSNIKNMETKEVGEIFSSGHLFYSFPALQISSP